MKSKEIQEFLNRYNFHQEANNHFIYILDLISNKMCYPEISESKFVTLISEEKFEQAEYIADHYNKQGFNFNFWQEFVEFVKQSDDYILINRKRNLKELIDE
jgi:hypothetical protein